MRIAVAGGTGTVGRHVVEAARARGHEVVVISRSTGVDLRSGDGLDAVLDGVETVIDTVNAMGLSAAANIAAFETVSRTLLAAETRVGVKHHVALSIVGIDSGPRTSAYYQGKLAQERVVASGPVPWTVLRATQFHEFARQMFERAKVGPLVFVPRMRSQPVAARDVASRLVDCAEAPAAGRVRDLAGPRVERMADLVRRYGRAAGLSGHVVEMTLPGVMGRQMRDGSLLPGPDAERSVQTFDQWLLEETGHDGAAPVKSGAAIGGFRLTRGPLPELPEPSLSNARELISGLETAGLPIMLAVDGDPRPLPPRIDATAFEALQEGTSLVLMRGPGSDATAIVRYLPDAVEIQVTHGPCRPPKGQVDIVELSRTRGAIRSLGGMTTSTPRPDGSLSVTARIPTPPIVSHHAAGEK